MPLEDIWDETSSPQLYRLVRLPPYARLEIEGGGLDDDLRTVMEQSLEQQLRARSVAAHPFAASQDVYIEHITPERHPDHPIIRCLRAHSIPTTGENRLVARRPLEALTMLGVYGGIMSTRESFKRRNCVHEVRAWWQQRG